MQKLILLYWGTFFLMYLSEKNYPSGVQLRGYSGEEYHFMQRKSDWFMMIAIFWISAFSFLRTSYNDTVNYIWEFNNVSSLSGFFASGGLFDWTGNPLHELYRTIIHEFTDNYHVYFFFPAVLNGVTIIKLYKRYSVNVSFSLMVFFAIGTYVMYMAALKQSIAVAILSMAIPYAIDRKYGRFYLLVFLAMLFHTHAFMFAVVPLLFGKPWGKMTWIMLAAVLFAMLTYDRTLGAFMNFAQDLGAMVAESEVFDGHQINILRVMVYAVPAVLAFVFRRRLFSNSTREENLFVNMCIVAVLILSIGIVEGANLYARMAAYFEVAMGLALPWMIKKLFTRDSARMITGLASVLYFGYFLYEHGISKSFGEQYRAISLWQFIVGLFI